MIHRRRVLALIFTLSALVALAAFVALATPQGAAPAAKRAPLFAHPVHFGSISKQVKAFKWVASGHKPSQYAKTIRVFHGPMTNECGKPCVRAILATRWLLGVPLKYDKRC